MVTSHFRYSSDDLLKLRPSKCPCLSRTVRRRLFYHGIFIRHIPVVVTSRSCRRLASRPPFPVENSTVRGRQFIRCRAVIRRSSHLSNLKPSILLTNARSLGNKFDELSLLITRHCPDFCVITETWLDPTVPNDSIGLSEYSLFRCDRSHRAGGGMICYVRNKYSAVFVDTLSILSPLVPRSEYMFLFFKELRMVLIVIYHPFWNNSEAHNEAISCLMSLVDFAYVEFGSDIRIVLTGDFNDLRKQYVTLSTLLDLKPIVDFPTRKEHVLDQIFVNFARDVKPLSIPPLGNSDHCVVFWPSSSYNRVIVKKKTRRFSRANLAKFSDYVSSTDWLSVVNSCDTVSSATSLFHKLLYELFCHCFPEKTVRFRPNEPSWMKCSLKLLINDRDRAFHKRHWFKYNRLKKDVCDHILYLKKTFLQEATVADSPKRLWKTLRTLSRSAKSSASSNFSADDFCQHFASNFQATDLVDYPLDNASKETLSVTCAEVHAQLRKISKSCIGPDGIPPWIFRVYADFFAPVISALFNWSLRDGVFPQFFKMANVCPIPKCERPSLVSDFRPISILPTTAKVFERILVKKFILPTVKDSVNASQFAFIPRPGSGTTCALVLVQNKILRFLDSASGAVRILSIDLSKAFDKVSHSVIVNSCKEFSLSAPIVKLICNFLCNRFQRVFYNNVYSEWTSIPSGVPQGSVLGPILFALAIDNFASVCTNTTVIKYADDILFLHFIRHANEDRLQDEWDHLMSWSQSHHLPVNEEKCLVMDIITKSSITTIPIRVTDKCVLRQVDSFSYLGLILSCDMKWNKHVSCIVKKASRRVFIIRNLKRAGCSVDLLYKSYVAFIRSILTYAFPSFCNASEYVLRDILRVERRIFRIIGIQPCDTDESVLDAANKSCNKLFNVICNCDSHPLRDIFEENPSQSIRTRNTSRFYIPRTKTVRFKNSFIKFCKSNCK